MPHTALLLLSAAFLALAAFGVAGITVARAQEERRKTAARITQVAVPAGSARAATPIRITRTDDRQRRPLWRQAAALFGFDPLRARHYKPRESIVLAGAFGLARLAAALAAPLVGPFSLLLLPVGTVALSRAFFGWSDLRYRQRLLTQLPDALAMIVRSVRIGIPVTEAVRIVAQEAPQPTMAEFAELHEALLIGVPLEQGLREMGRRTGLGEYRFFATAIALQAQTGGGLSEVLENLADVIRKRVALQSRGRALSSEARTSALVLAVLPVLIAGMIWFLDPSYMEVLFTTPAGHRMLGAAVLSLGTGVGAMRFIIQRTLA